MTFLVDHIYSIFLVKFYSINDKIIFLKLKFEYSEITKISPNQPINPLKSTNKWIIKKNILNIYDFLKNLLETLFKTIDNRYRRCRIKFLAR